MADEEHIRELKERTRRILRWVEKETGFEASPVDEERATLLEESLRWVHHLRDAPPSVETDSGVKANPDHNALRAHMTAARQCLDALQKTVLAARAARLEKETGPDLDEMLRRRTEELLGKSMTN